MSSKIIAIVFGVNFKGESTIQLGRVELDVIDTINMTDPYSVMQWLEKSIVTWIDGQHFNPDEYPCMQVHVQLWNGRVLTVQHQHFYRVDYVSQVVFSQSIDRKFLYDAEFEERLANGFFKDWDIDIEIDIENFGVVEMQVLPSVSVFNLIRHGRAKTSSVQLESKLTWRPFIERPAN